MGVQAAKWVAVGERVLGAGARGASVGVELGKLVGVPAVSSTGVSVGDGEVVLLVAAVALWVGVGEGVPVALGETVGVTLA